MWVAPPGFPAPRRRELTLPRVQAALGVPLAMLADPDDPVRIGTRGHNATVDQVRLAYYPRGGGYSTDLTTCRPLHGESLEQVIWDVFGNYRLSTCGQTGAPWGPGPPPEAVIAELAAAPAMSALYPLTLDGVSRVWRGIEAAHLVTAEPLAACGSAVDGCVIVAAGPRRKLDGLAITRVAWNTIGREGPGGRI